MFFDHRMNFERVGDSRTYTLPGLDESQAYLRIHVRGDNEWQITKLYVAPHLRRQGIAGRLLRLTIAQADRQRVTLTLVAEPDSGSISPGQLRRFYQRHGFVEIGIGKTAMKRPPR